MVPIGSSGARREAQAAIVRVLMEFLPTPDVVKQGPDIEHRWRWLRPATRRKAHSEFEAIALDNSLRAAASAVPLEFETPAGTKRVECLAEVGRIIVSSQDDFSFADQLRVELRSGDWATANSCSADDFSRGIALAAPASGAGAGVVLLLLAYTPRA